MRRAMDGAAEQEEGREGWRFRDSGGPGARKIEGGMEMHEHHFEKPANGEDREFRPIPGRACEGPMGHPHHGHHGCGRHHGGPGMGPHRHHMPMPDITQSEHYAALDADGRLAVMLRELGHAGRFLLEGKGGQSRILELLAREDGMTQRELTARIGIQPGSASEILGKLEGAGLISRVPNEEDRRTVDLHLTEAGRARLEEGSAAREARVREIFDGLTGEEKEALLGLLEKLHTDWRERLRKDHEARRAGRGQERTE